MTNYIGKIEAEWVDPAEETPMGVPTGSINPPAWEGLADFGEAPINPGLQFCAYHDDHGWSVGIDGMPFPLRWLRIGGPSDAIPREAVQAAVDDIEETVRMFVGHAEADWRGCISDGLSDAIKAITHHTGVTPSEVSP